MDKHSLVWVFSWYLLTRNLSLNILKTFLQIYFEKRKQLQVFLTFLGTSTNRVMDHSAVMNILYG